MLVLTVTSVKQTLGCMASSQVVAHLIYLFMAVFLWPSKISLKIVKSLGHQTHGTIFKNADI